MSEDKYLNRITSQHRIQPKYMAWLSALLGKIQDLNDITKQVDAAFDVEEAVGVQLDALGQIVGVSRLLNFEPKYAPSAMLPDDYYRTIIKAKTSLNQWDGTTAGIKQLWEEIFAGYTMDVIDNQDMTMTIRVYDLYAPFEAEYISHGYAAPKPEGVGVHYEFVLNLILNTGLYIGAKVSNIRSSFELEESYFLEDMNVSTGLHTGGRITDIRSNFILQCQKSAKTMDLPGPFFIGGIAENTRTRFMLSVRDSPNEMLDLVGKICITSGAPVFRSAFNLPDETN